MKITPSCEISDLIDFFSNKLGKTWSEVEGMAYKEGISPKGGKSFLTIEYDWGWKKEGTLSHEVQKWMKEQGIKNLYITTAI